MCELMVFPQKYIYIIYTVHNTNCNLSKKGQKKCNTSNVYSFSNLS